MINKVYQPTDFEGKRYRHWEEAGYFQAGVGKKPDKPTFSILLPPPNITGTLHMGHAFQHTLMDTLIRYYRMQGFDVLWQPGTDHAGIATQLVVERQLESEGKSRETLGREAFLARVWQWKETSGRTITRQMRRLGTSCDWSREKFTMEDELSDTVTDIFVRLYREGLIYRGKRLVNWDPKLQTAVSDLEVEFQEQNGYMWHICYPFSRGEQLDHQGKPIRGMTIATTRPETMLADGALAVHPDDDRYQHLIGLEVDLPLCNRSIPIIADDFVDREFGSGCVKITGAHDFNDYACAMRHEIPLIVIMDMKANMNALAPPSYRGLNRYAARDAIVSDLKTQGFLEKTDAHQNKVPICTRSGEIIEPMLTDQWFVQMEHFAKEGLRPIHEGSIQFIPGNWVNTYRQWLENIQDWCISRQLWWGHRIPAWFDEEGNIYVARNYDEASQLANGRPLRQDEDVLDTWFSSAFWPFSTLGWSSDNTPSNALLHRYLPSSVMITGFDIIFFWVARMVMMTEHILHQRPFHHVHITGLVRDAAGQKMSKSKGNIIDPIDLMDGIDLTTLLKKRTVGMLQPHLREKIEKETRQHFPDGIAAVGADALRFTFVALASHGRDIKFDHHRCAGYRNFCTKLWNATRFVLIQCEGQQDKLCQAQQMGLLESTPPTFVEQWMMNRLQYAEEACAEHFSQYRFDLLARTVFELIWNDFCDWFVEACKVQLQKSHSDTMLTATRLRLVRILETILRLAHPIIPFITEELWHAVAPLMGKSMDQHPTIMLEPYPTYQPEKIKPEADSQFATLQALVDSCRKLRSEMKQPPQQKIPLYITGSHTHLPTIIPYLKALAGLEAIHQVAHFPNQLAPIRQVENLSMMLLVHIDEKAEQERLNQEMTKLDTDINKITTQLENAQFIERAPADIIERQRQRLTELQNKHAALRQTLSRLLSS